MTEHPEVTLGRVRVPCIAQPQARVFRRLTKHVLALFDREEDGGDEQLDIAGAIARLGASTYDVACVFFPQLATGTQAQRMERWEFESWSSKEAFEAGEDTDDGEPTGPSIPELIDAFTLAIKINRLNELKQISKLVDPKKLKAWVDARLDRMIAEAGATTPTEASQISPSTSGASPSTSTSPPSPISLVNTA